MLEFEPRFHWDWKSMWSPLAPMALKDTGAWVGKTVGNPAVSIQIYWAFFLINIHQEARWIGLNCKTNTIASTATLDSTEKFLFPELSLWEKKNISKIFIGRISCFGAKCAETQYPTCANMGRGFLTSCFHASRPNKQSLCQPKMLKATGLKNCVCSETSHEEKTIFECNEGMSNEA